jgi:uncharacterized protein YfaT (DUF1175 family)
MALAGAFLLTVAPSVSAAAPKTEAAQIIKIAKAQRGDPWRYGANGPSSFDCSGLVRYAYRKAGDLKVLGAGHRTAGSMYRYFKAKGLASRHNPKPGDLVVWGYHGHVTHIGIYIGKGKAISTLVTGVRIHGVHVVRAHFMAYLHTGMSKKTTSGASVTAAAAKAVVSSKHQTRHTTTAVNLRSAAGISHHRIAVIRDGATLTVLGKARDAAGRTWYHVRVGTRTGYVAGWLTR